MEGIWNCPHCKDHVLVIQGGNTAHCHKCGCNWTITATLGRAGGNCPQAATALTKALVS